MTKLYDRGTWVDELLAGAERYDILEDGGAAFKANMRILLATAIATPGTSLTADMMNNIEAGIDALDDLLNSIRNASVELSIASDAITITQSNHKLQPQSGTSDNLSTISGTVAGQSGVLTVSDFGTDTITIKHNVGNILCPGGSDISLSYGCVKWYSDGTKIHMSGGGGGGMSDGDKGDITVGGSGTTLTIDNGAVTLVKMADMATASLLGRNTAGAGVPEVLSAATVKTLLGIPTTGQIELLAKDGAPALTSGCAVPVQIDSGSNDINYWALDFDPTTSEIAIWNFIWPADYNGGTVTAKFLWAANAAAGNTVTWGVQGRSHTNDAVINAGGYGTAQEVTDTEGTVANSLMYSDATAAITITSASPGRWCSLKVYRNIADTCTVDARLIAVILTYTKS